MNEAFGNPPGDYRQPDIKRLRKQCQSIFHEAFEAMVALGLNPTVASNLSAYIDNALKTDVWDGPANVLDLRDALCDVQVFAAGAQHFLGVDGDEDMHVVIDGVMTRFIKDEADEAATIAMHAGKGVSQVYFEGDYPTRVMKSLKDQPDAPQGKFLKSASYSEPVFPYPRLKAVLQSVNVPESTAKQLADNALGFEVEKTDGYISNIRVDMGAGILNVYCSPEALEARDNLL